jgi:hypothetical protein
MAYILGGSGNGFDESKYTEHHYPYPSIPSSSGAYTTILNLTGKGKLYTALIGGGTNITQGVKITIDGVLYIWNEIASSYNKGVFCNELIGASEPYLIDNLTSIGSVCSYAANYNLPSAGKITDNVVALKTHNGIYFNNSCKIEYMSTEVVRGFFIYLN